MNLSITFVMLLPFAVCMAAPMAPTEAEMLHALINPPMETHVSGSAATSSNSNSDNMVGNLALESDKSIKPQSITALKEALAAKVKSQLMTSMAAFTPELTSTAGISGTNELSQLNLMGGINKLVGMIVDRLLQALLPNIFGQNSAPTPPMGGSTGGFGFPGMFGSMSSMNPMSMFMPSMMFGFMDNMIDFI